MEYLSDSNQKILGAVYSVFLANFLWAASVCTLNSSYFFVRPLVTLVSSLLAQMPSKLPNSGGLLHQVTFDLKPLVSGLMWTEIT